jgi:PIN domain nuclease of toxin-antitoxin system
VGRDEVIVLDTHVAIWITANEAMLGERSRLLVEKARIEDRIVVSAISFWEMAMLIAKGRLRAITSAMEQRGKILASSIEEIPLTGEIAILAGGLENLHGDPADRLIAATAIAHDATLMTADKALLRWRHKLPRQDASK